jgi:hypothetical protein
VLSDWDRAPLVVVVVVTVVVSRCGARSDELGDLGAAQSCIRPGA